MARSLKVKSECIQKVKNALQRNGFPSIVAFAKTVTPVRATVSNFFNGKPVDFEYFVEICEKLGLDWQEVTELTPDEVLETESVPTLHIDLENAPDVSLFYGRTEEIANLERWIVQENCRLIGLYGFGGIGKTTLAVTLSQKIQNQFQFVIWRSLRNAPLLENLLEDLIKVLSNQQETQLPNSIDEKISHVIRYLNQHRCLLILDNAESIMLEETQAGYFRQGYEGYKELLKQVGELYHKSCVILTSRENPKEIMAQAGENLPVRSMRLSGLKIEEIKNIFKIISDDSFSASEEVWQKLIEQYRGNPKLLRMAATDIQGVFGGSIESFLQQTLYNGHIELIKEHFERLSEIEKDIMYWLAINRDPVDLSQLKQDFLPSVRKAEILESIKSLIHRSLIETLKPGIYTLQPIVMEYITNRLIEEVCEEIQTGRISTLNRYALILATSQDYIREIQERFLMEPIRNRLLALLGNVQDLESHFRQIIKNLHNQSHLPFGYAVGNLINLLRYLKTDLRGWDFSGLTIRQAFLREVNLERVNFSNADLSNSVFLETFSSVLSVALSPDGKLLAVADTDGRIHLWEIHHDKLLFIKTFKSHTHWIRSIAFSPDSTMLASGSDDQTVRLWDVKTGECLEVFEGHISRVRAVAFSPDGKMLVSGGDDRIIRVRDVSRRELITTLTGHEDRVRSVVFSADGKTLVSASEDRMVFFWNLSTYQHSHTFNLQEHGNHPLRSLALSPDGQIFASGSDDHTVRLWNISTGECLETLTGHTNWIRSLVFSPDGKILASSSEDHTVRLWDVETSNCLQTLQGHSSRVWSSAFTPDGQILVSGSDDPTIKLWNVSRGECLRTLRGESYKVRVVTFSLPDGQFLAIGGNDQTVRLWDISKREYIKVFEGHKGRIWSVAFSPDGKWLVSGNDDRTVKLWDVSTGECLKTFSGHTNWIRSVAFSPDGSIIASSSDDKTVKLWDVATGQLLKTLERHTDWVRSVAFTPDGEMLASSSDDGTIKLWNSATGEWIKTLSGHKDMVWSIAISPDGQTLASGSNDKTLKLWNIESGQCYETLNKHSDWVRSVAFSPDGKTLASGSYDQTVRLWDLSTFKCKYILQEYGKEVISVAFSPDSRTLATGCKDGTIKICEVENGVCQTTLRGPRPYEGMIIKGVKGLTAAQIDALKTLGAVD